MKWDVHFWLGSVTTQDEAGTAAYKTVELDDFLGGYPVEHREVEGYESDTFLSYFPNGVQILIGGFINVFRLLTISGIDSGFRHVETAGKHRTRLLHIKGRGNKVAAVEVPLSASSLNSGDVFVLDHGNTVFMFVGKILR